MRVTIKDVAKEAGVSVSTVSYALSRKGPPIKDSHKRVRAAVEKLGYVPDATARSLVNSRTNSVGVIIGKSSENERNPYNVEFINAFSSELGKTGNWMCLYIDSEDDKSTLESLLIDAKVDGLIWINGLLLPAQSLEILKRRGLPAVSVSVRRDMFDYFETNIIIDDQPGINQAIDYLYKLGHREILMLSGNEKCHRTAFGKKYLKEHNLDYIKVIPAYFNEEKAYSEISGIIQRSEKLPTAIMSANDAMAISAMRALTEHGIRVPEDVSVVGFDDIYDAKISSPPLTTISQDIYGIAKMACDKILSIREGDENTDKTLISETRLVIRASTGPAAKR